MDFFSVEYAEHLAHEYAVPFAIRLVIALAVFIIGRAIAKALRRGLVRMLGKRVDETLSKFLGGVAYAILMTVVAIAALQQLGVETTAAIAVLGAAGLAVGLALQGSLGNFAAGVMIILFRPYRVGDFINAAGVMGSVREIEIFNTVLTTPDNRRIIVPNGAITSGTIENFSAEPTRRVDMVFGCAYEDDILAAKKLLERIVAEHPAVLADPPAQVVVLELADSSVNFAVRPWVNSADWWSTKCEITEKVKVEFDKAGISIPFPQRDVHIHQAA